MQILKIDILQPSSIVYAPRTLRARFLKAAIFIPGYFNHIKILSVSEITI